MTAHASWATTAIVTLIAFVKVRYIGLEFMELRHAPLLLRLGFELWTAVICIAMLALYFMGQG